MFTGMAAEVVTMTLRWVGVCLPFRIFSDMLLLGLHLAVWKLHPEP